ncbi:MAG: DUF6602 domain-containing protein [Candidatus Electronema sp. VV]
MNPIRTIIQCKIDNIIQLAESVGSLRHNSTAGALREQYLSEFLREIVPDTVSVTSGFIADSFGNISPQLDLIVTKKSLLPLVTMKDGLSIVPVESAILAAEIKSNLTLSDLDQVKKQNKAISELKPTVQDKDGLVRFIIPTIVLSYDTEISKKKIVEWMEEPGNTQAFCILKKHTYFRGDFGVQFFENGQNGIKHYGTLAFITMFHRALNFLAAQRNFEPVFDNYLIGI